MRQTLTITVLIASIIALPAFTAAQAPDLIVHHGKVVTVDAQFQLAEAFAVRDGRIVSVGKNDEILKLAGDKTKLLDVGGKTVIPGLCDSHVHPISAAMHEFDHPIPEMDTVADVLQYVAKRAEVLDDGDWIVVSQVFITRLRDQRYPTRKELDAVAPKNPVLFSTGPDASCNSLALQLSGIDKNFEIKDGQSGQIEKDPATGEPTGILRNASRFVKTKSKSKGATADQKAAQLKKLLSDYNAVGLTSLADRNASDDSIVYYQKLKDAGELTCRIFLSYSVNGQAPQKDIEERILKGAKHPLHKYDSMLWLRGVKVFLDGGMLTGSAYMNQPWGKSEIYSITDPEYRGLKFIQQAALVQMARFALKSELQFTAHSVGDGAIEALADAYAEINKEFPVAPHRPCITHCNFMSLKAIQQMEQLGIVADLQPAWLWLDGATLRKQFGDERLTYFQPYKTLFERGVRVGGGSDHMQKIGSLRSVNPYNPFLAMWVAMARQARRTDQPLHPEQGLTREQALRLYTINNAWLTFEEKEKGSLESGKLADFVVLNTDFLECPLDEVKSITVDKTFLGGKQVYSAEKQVSAVDQKYGHERVLFDVNGHQAFVIRPNKPASNGQRPWAWYAPTFIKGHPNQSNEWLFKQLLDAGWSIGGIEVGESFGSPAGRAIYSEFYARVVKEFRLDPKACLVPQSRGGLMLYNWAAENTDKVQCIAGIYTVCDIRSYPGIRNAAPAYGLTEGELTQRLAEHNPIDRLEQLARAKIPILHIHGDSDTVVPLDRNSQVVYDRYQALGGSMQLLVIKGKGHAEIPEFFQSPEMLKFLLDQKQ